MRLGVVAEVQVDQFLLDQVGSRLKNVIPGIATPISMNSQADPWEQCTIPGEEPTRRSVHAEAQSRIQADASNLGKE